MGTKFRGDKVDLRLDQRPGSGGSSWQLETGLGPGPDEGATLTLAAGYETEMEALCLLHEVLLTLCAEKVDGMVVDFV